MRNGVAVACALLLSACAAARRPEVKPEQVLEAPSDYVVIGDVEEARQRLDDILQACENYLADRGTPRVSEAYKILRNMCVRGVLDHPNGDNFVQEWLARPETVEMATRACEKEMNKLLQITQELPSGYKVYTRQMQGMSCLDIELRHVNNH